MRILQVIGHYVPAYRFGGPLHVAHQLGKALVEQGHEVRVCTTNLSTLEQTLKVPTGRAVNVEGVTVFYSPVVISRKWGFSYSMRRRLRDEVPAADVVVIHAHFQYANWIGARLARGYRKPYVIFAHSSLRAPALRSSNYWLKRLYLRCLEWRNLGQAGFVVFNAEEEKADSLFSERGVVIPNGIDPGSYELPSRRRRFREQHPELKDKFCFLFLGRIDIRQKAVDLIVEAFSGVVTLHRHAHLIIAGPSEGSDAETIQSIVKEKELDEHVTMVGLVSGAEKVALLYDCDVFLLPSRYEGLSIGLLEALYLRRPVILSRYAGLAEKVSERNCGIIVNPHADNIRDGMLEMLSAGEDQRIAMGMKGRELVLQEHTWENIASQLVAALDRLKTRPRPRCCHEHLTVE